ncbi:MAG: hypothetical protein EON87_02950 [Brevundimonas sp.]|nr:MAG: hypothetical protein EON87_02950 [Brevundimonas sp.]
MTIRKALLLSTFLALALAPAPVLSLETAHAAATAVTAAQEGEGFAPLGAWSVRVDRVENPREDRLVHVYLTLRNDSTRQLMQTENISVLFEDSTGITVESGQGLKAEPGYPQLFGSPPPVVEPGREIRTKFVFDRNRGASAVRVTVQEGQDYSADFEF